MRSRGRTEVAPGGVEQCDRAGGGLGPVGDARVVLPEYQALVGRPID